MKIGVFGHHPDLYPGFNALMSANFVYGFSRLGHDVTLLLPEVGIRSQHARLAKLGKSVSDVDSFEAEAFDIRVIEPDTDLGRFDLVVWQSYFKEDEAFWPAIRKAARVVAKNTPRLLVGDPDRDARIFKGIIDRYDIVGLALNSDFALAAKSFASSQPEALKRCLYQPRGFRQDWLVPNDDFDGAPVFGIEKGVGTSGDEYSYLVPVLEELRRRHGTVDLIGARFDDPRLTTRRIGLLPARQFYRQFLAPLWAFLMINVDHSRQSKNAFVINGRTVYPGLYENQIVEAQLAGAAVVGQADALPEELVGSTMTGLRFDRYSQTDEIVEFLDQVVRNRPTVSVTTKAWARTHHSIDAMIAPLLAMAE